MDRNVFAAVALCAAIFMAWQHFYLKPITEQQQAAIRAKQTQQAKETAASESVHPTAAISTAVKKSEPTVRPTTVTQTRTLSASNGFSATISTLGGKIVALEMGTFRDQKTSTTKDLAAALVGGGTQLEVFAAAPEWTYLSGVNYTVVSDSKDSLTLAYQDDNISLTRKFSIIAEQHSLNHEALVQFKKTPPQYLFVGLQATRDISKDKSENERRELLFNKITKNSSWTLTDVTELKEEVSEGQWLAFSSRYFLKALVDQGSTVKPQFQAKPLDGGIVAANLIYKTTGNTLNLSQKIYFGPKDTDLLKKVGQRLDLAVDFGWFTFFAYPLLEMLKWFYKFIHNFGIAIILLTIVVKLLTYPLTYKSMKSMKEMQVIQPQIQKLRDKYKDDKEKLNREMLQLMKTHGYNPMSGCLPIFIQMPVFIALYNVLYGAIDLYGQPFFGWITDLSAKDPYFVTPVLLGVLMFVQQKLTPTTATDPAQQKVLMFMPVIFSVMMLWLPSGLTLYMLVNSVASIVQQLIINRKLNIRPAAAAG